MSDVFSGISFDVPLTFPAPDLGEPEVQSILFEGPNYQGNPTKVFAFYGFPENQKGPVPGMILVHGGGGTAFAEWVRLWVRRGYAAIALDTCGALPIGKYSNWQRYPEGGPSFDLFAAIDKPATDQWMYHAVANVVRAHSLLRSFPNVDETRIGITGISWGAVISCNAAPIDGRFRFVAPVYGCGYISHPCEDGTQFIGQDESPEKVKTWNSLWDPLHRLPRLEVPLLWVTGTNDFAFTLRAVMLSAECAAGPSTFCIRPRMPHGHEGPGENPEEIRAFADHLLQGKDPLTTILQDGQDQQLVWVEWKTEVPISTLKLNYTLENGNWQARNWEEKSVVLESGVTRAATDLPSGAVAWYFNIEDKAGRVMSSPVKLASGNFAL